MGNNESAPKDGRIVTDDATAVLTTSPPANNLMNNSIEKPVIATNSTEKTAISTNSNQKLDVESEDTRDRSENCCKASSSKIENEVDGVVASEISSKISTEISSKILTEVDAEAEGIIESASSKSTEERVSFPDDCWHSIFRFLPISDISRLRMCSKGLRFAACSAGVMSCKHPDLTCQPELCILLPSKAALVISRQSSSQAQPGAQLPWMVASRDFCEISG